MRSIPARAGLPRFARALVVALVGLLAAAAGAETVITMTDTGNAVTNGDNLKTELTNAANRAGDTRLRLPAGAFFDYPVVSPLLPNKTLDNGYVTIESTNLSSLVEGKRVGPGDAANMPKIRSTRNGMPAIRTQPGAHHYRFRGIDFSAGPGIGMSELIQLGVTGGSQNTIASMPHHIDLDRCYIHADTTTPGAIVHALSIHTAYTTVSNCYISGIKSSAEAQAIWNCTGSGPYFYVNNYLEAAGENYMSGGGGTDLPNGMIPCDVTFKRNYSFKPTAWRNLNPGVSVKNLFEIKFGKRFDIQGNVFENTWAGQQEFAICFKIDGNNATSNFQDENVTQDVLFQNNRISHAPAAVFLQGRDWLANWQPRMERITVRNNLFTDIDMTSWGALTGLAGTFFYATHGPKNYTIEHNTSINERYSYTFDANQWPQTGMVIRNNISSGNASTNPIADVYNLSTPVRGTAGLVAISGGTYTWTKNVIKGTTPGSLFTGSDLTTNWWTPDWNFLQGNGSEGSNYTGYKVDVGSVYDNGATDGTDVGCDIDVMNAATAGCVSGQWTTGEIVLYPGQATTRFGTWSPLADSTAADGMKIRDPDGGAATVAAPAASPANYFEMTFNAQAGVPYRLWMRMRADSNNVANDSVWVQFNNSVNSTGGAIYRIGTTNGTAVDLENVSGGVQDWGWTDNDTNANGSGALIYFSTTGTQTIRVQRREDGVSIDQIVLSPCTYLSTGPTIAAPGTIKTDTTILAKTTAAPPQSVTKVLRHNLNGYTGATSFHVFGGAQGGVHTGYPNSVYYHPVNQFAVTNSSMIRPFYRFDLNQGANAIPANAVIDSATLKIKVDAVSGSGSNDIMIHRVVPVTSFTVNYSTATRNTYNGTTQWTGGQNAAGEVADANNDFLDTPDDTQALPLSVPTTPATFLTFNVTSSVQAWVNGAPNNGWLFRTAARAASLSSTIDSGGTAEYAELTITYH